MTRKVLIVIDMQQGVDSPHDKLFNLSQNVAAINHRISLYREKNMPVFCPTSGSSVNSRESSMAIYAQLICIAK